MRMKSAAFYEAGHIYVNILRTRLCQDKPPISYESECLTAPGRSLCKNGKGLMDPIFLVTYVLVESSLAQMALGRHSG